MVPEIFKFEKCSKYANEITDDVIVSTQYNIKCTNRVISVNLQQRALKLVRLIVLQATYLCLQKFQFYPGSAGLTIVSVDTEKAKSS